MTITIDDYTQTRHRAVTAARKRRWTHRQLQGIPTSLVDVAPVREHLRALTALHWTPAALVEATQLDASPDALLRILRDETTMTERRVARILRFPLTLWVPPTVDDHTWVPIASARRRLQALHALGWRHEDLRPVAGVRTRNVGARTSERPTIEARTWRAVDHVYRTLQARRGPSDRTAARAALSRFAPPAAWDDIDDPTGRPRGVARRAAR